MKDAKEIGRLFIAFAIVAIGMYLWYLILINIFN